MKQIERVLYIFIAFCSIAFIATITTSEDFFTKQEELEKVIKIDKRVRFVDYFPLEGKRYSLIFRDLDTDEEFPVNFTDQCDFKDKLNQEFLITQECNYRGDTLLKCEYYNLPIKLCY